MLSARDLRGPNFGPIDLDLEAGETTCLSGPSGSGKSQLLRALADLDRHQGEVTLHDRPQGQYRPVEWRRRVGLLPAEPQWWDETVGDHFRHAIPPAALETLGLPAGVAEWPVTRLSSGERQRLGLLRLLDGAPEVLLLDEPTANLDAGNTARIEGLVGEYLAKHRAAVLWVSHDPEQWARIADHHREMPTWN